MTLSIKAALLVSLGFIGSMSWLLHAYGLDSSEAPSILAFPEPEARPTGTDRPLLVFSESQGDWEQRFGYPSTLEREVENNRRLQDRLVIVRSTLPAQAPLPPQLAHEQAAAERAAADPATTAAPVALDNAGNTARPDGLNPAESAKRYVVQRGDSLSRLARRFGPDQNRTEAYVRELLAANPAVAKRNGVILAGEELIIPDRVIEPQERTELAVAPAAREAAPRAGTLQLAGPTTSIPESRAARTVDAIRVAAESRPASRGEAEHALAREAVGSPAAPEWYVIQPHDTLARIAARRLKDETRWREIVKQNQGLRADRVVPGMRIKLPPVQLAQR